MSVVMSTMAKQQQTSAPPVFKLNAICEKLKRTPEHEEEEDEDETGDDDDLYRRHVVEVDEACRQNGGGESSSVVMYDENDDDDNDDNDSDGGSNAEYGVHYEIEIEDQCPPVTNVVDSGGGRRNKRKNFKPRNIVYQYESCEDGEGGDESPRGQGLSSPVEMDTGLPVDLSVRSHSPAGESESDCDSLAMDLTKGGARGAGEDESNSSDTQHHVSASSPRGVVNSPEFYPSASRRVDDGKESSPPSSPCGPSTGDASTLKDYAESTMKELLSLYGFNDAESITKNVPLDNFSSGKILQTMSPRIMMSSRKLKNPCPTPPTPTSSAVQVSNNQRTPSPQQINQQPFHQVHPHHAHQSQHSRHLQHHRASSEGNYDSLCTKVVDSMAKLAHLPPNSVIGNPRVILPPNMTSTILSLAAMQESKFAAAAMATPSPMSKGPRIHQLLPQNLRKAQPSVIVSSSSSVLPLLPHHKEHMGKSVPIDYTRYVKRYSNANECGSNYCKDLNYREHFHCMDCNSRVFVKKEEMIRHFKWHKKRDESLQHGFLRFSPMDDCSERFRNCSHNRKQTHYHCLKDGCDKVYISTSDVQMHANYHRKDSAIIQEGFQRFRATEDCGMLACSFHGQRTTHFHCRRANCNYTFKNKADMEKHKTYHIKDEQLNKDGFKKFMKHEHCTYENCRYSRVCNHIHCIRAGCTYVLHSSGQLYSHKRKHERRENELAYRKYKLAQSMLKTLGDGQALALSNQMSEEGNSSESTGSGIHAPSSAIPLINSSVSVGGQHPPTVSGINVSSPMPIPLLSHAQSSKAPSDRLPTPSHLSAISSVERLASVDLDLLKPKADDSWKKYLIRYTANDPCKPNCEFLYKDHYHCTTDNCTMTFRSKDGIREHARTHEQQEQVTEAFYTTVEVGQAASCSSECPYQNREKHYHCGWENCQEIILPSDKPFRRLDHYKMHDYSRKLSPGKDNLNISLSSSMDAMFRRKRGRPPKNRIIEVWPQFPVPSSASDLPQAIFTSFKLPKPTPSHLNLGSSVTTSSTQSFLDTPPISAMAMPFDLLPASMLSGRPGTSSMGHPPTTLPLPLMSHMASSPMQSKVVEDVEGFYVFPPNTPCPDRLCSHLGRLHYHCMRNRCHYATDHVDILAQHSLHFHGQVDILEGFAHFGADVDCRTSWCPNNKNVQHFHCTRPNCNYSFMMHTKMVTHNQEQHCEESCVSTWSVPKSPSPETKFVVSEQQNGAKTTVVKATGTFYPLSALPLRNLKKMNEEIRSEQKESTNGVVGTEEEFEINGDSNGQSFGRQPHFVVKGYHQEQQLQHVEHGAHNPCGRPFCKMKNIQHFHCNICNQAFSNYFHLQPHLAKHMESPHPFAAAHGNFPVGDDNSGDGDDGENDQDNGHELQSGGEAEMVNSTRHLNLNSSTESLKNLHANLFQSAIADGPIYFPPQHPLLPGYQSLLAHHQQTVRGEERSSPQHNGNNSNNNNNNNNNNNEFDAEHSSQESPYSCVASPNMEECGETNPHSPRFMGMGPSRKRNSSPRHEDLESKKMRMASSLNSLRILKDEPVPRGYIRYRFNEDCQYQHCGYREHQTHFHCMRRDCGYSFCDKTRFVQHTARHERLDTLMGGDFQQFRANVACGRPDCLYTISMATSSGSSTNKASHFHCIKCEYVCTDTNKVVAHRRQHQKLDNIMAAGFEKFTPTQNCNIEGCTHNQKQTHYHCMKCQYAVLGLSQMSAHKYRHLEG